MKRNWHIVNLQPNKENPTLSDGQICTNQAIGSPAVNFYASDPILLTKLLADAEIGSHKREEKQSEQHNSDVTALCHT